MLQYVEKRGYFMRQITIKSYETKKSIVMPLVFLVIGIMLIANPGGIVDFISYIFGGIFLALGFGKIVMDSKNLDRTTGDTFYSVLMVVLGIIFICFSGTIDFIIRLAIGLWIIVNGINAILIGTNFVRINKKNYITLAIGFILLAMGLYTIFVENLILQSIGIVITIYAILEIVDYFYIMAKNK